MDNNSIYLNQEIIEVVNKTHSFEVGGYGILDFKTSLIICLILLLSVYVVNTCDMPYCNMLKNNMMCVCKCKISKNTIL